MKKVALSFFSLMIYVLGLTGCSGTQAGDNQGAPDKTVELTISAAASLQDALTEITANFSKKHHDIKINYNFGGSGALKQQITQGAPVDLFFSAAEDQFRQLVQDGMIDKNQGTNLVSNELVLIVPKKAAKTLKSFADLPKVDKLSIGTPESVPAGGYAKETLGSLKVWDKVDGKIVYAKDVRQVLTYVEMGNVEAGVVYKTDALTSSKVEIAATADANTHTPIVYPVGIIKASSHPKEAMLFYEYLQTPEALKVFEKYGFKGL